MRSATDRIPLHEFKLKLPNKIRRTKLIYLLNDFSNCISGLKTITVNLNLNALNLKLSSILPINLDFILNPPSKKYFGCTSHFNNI